MRSLQNSSLDMFEIEFHVKKVLEDGGLDREVDRVLSLAKEKISSGRNVLIYTSRERLDLDTDNKEKQLEISVQISDAVTSIIGKLGVRPNFIIAKGA